MIQAHAKGLAPVGVYTLDVAETLVDEALNRARKHQYPLRFELESDGPADF